MKTTEQTTPPAARGHTKCAIVFARYDTPLLVCTGWVDNSSPTGDPETGATEGYNWEDYFRAGEYLGHDGFGIEPLFTVDSLESATLSAKGAAQ